MAKIGRNAPCPCGSGKKYKKCCYRQRETTTLPAVDSGWQVELSDLDELSNRVVDLIAKNRLDEAERACERLAREYPDQVDALERYAMLYEARGDHQKAAEHYRKAASFARRQGGFDAEILTDWLAQAARLDVAS